MSPAAELDFRLLKEMKTTHHEIAYITLLVIVRAIRAGYVLIDLKISTRLLHSIRKI
jgi:hypothetical protein